VQPKTGLRKRRELAVVIFIVSLIGFGTYGLGKRYRATHSVNPVAKIDVVAKDSKSLPDETPISPQAGYTVPADQPRSIQLPSLGVEGFIQRIDTDSEGILAVPSNVHVAGWYQGSVKPGQKGLSIIDGHVQGLYQEGIFKKLAQLKIGDAVLISFGDGSSKKFETVSVQSYPVAEAGAALFAQNALISNELNLITCGGNYDANAKTYAERVVVVAQLVS